MFKRYLCLLISLIVVISISFDVAYSAIKPGLSCKKPGFKSFQGTKVYVCQKSGSNLVWKKVQSKKSPKVPLATPSSTSTSPISLPHICRPDASAPSAWKPYQEYLRSIGNMCDLNFYRYQKIEATRYSGIQALTNEADYLPPETCQLKKSNNGPVLGFSSLQSKLSPLPFAKFQVIPIQTSDFVTKKTPQQDYGHFFAFLESWVKENSENGSSFEIRVPPSYIALNKSLKEYRNIDRHNNPTTEGQQFHKDIIAAADPFVDFSGTDLFLVVVPPQVNQDFLGTNPWGTQVDTQEGKFDKFFTITPFDFSHSGPNSGFLGPQLLLHELQHAYFDFGDHGDGMAGWGLMSLPSVTDLLGWDKYLAGFYSSKQIYCLPDSKTLSHLTPNVVRGFGKKLAVIPISPEKIVLIESVRSGGFNYKLPKISEGVLVYEINVNETDFHKGVTLITTERGKRIDRSLAATTGNLLGAPLKVGEFVITNGFKITNMESGNFGDIIQVERT